MTGCKLRPFLELGSMDSGEMASVYFLHASDNTGLCGGCYGHILGKANGNDGVYI